MQNGNAGALSSQTIDGEESNASTLRMPEMSANRIKKAMRAHLRSQTAKIKRQGDNKVIGFVFLPDLARNRAGYRPSRHRTE